jgi:dienelactone hydrolase
MKFAAVLSVFVALNLALLVLCFSGYRYTIFRRPWITALILLAGVETAAALGFVIGAYGEARWEVFSQRADLLSILTDEPAPIAERKGNPALLETLDTQQPPARPIGTNESAALQEWQTALRAMLLDGIFNLPDISKTVAPDFKLVASENLSGGIVRKLITITADDGIKIPAYLFIPPRAKQSPAILVIPGHVKENESGIEQTGIDRESHQHAAALRLAEAGFVTLTPELRGFGLLGKPYGTEHRLVAYNAILAGTFYKAIVTRDLKRAVDFLMTRQEVDSARVGITGTSYGGELSVLYAALDTRIKAISFHSYGGHVGTKPGVTGTKENQPHYCHVILGANLLMNREDIFILLAPRATLGIRGDRDTFSDETFSSILDIGWRAYQEEDKLTIVTEPGGHEYFVKPAIEFFRRHL